MRFGRTTGLPDTEGSNRKNKRTPAFASARTFIGLKLCIAEARISSAWVPGEVGIDVKPAFFNLATSVSSRWTKYVAPPRANLSGLYTTISDEVGSNGVGPLNSGPFAAHPNMQKATNVSKLRVEGRNTGRSPVSRVV